MPTLRRCAFLVAALLLVLYYLYHQYAPPYAIYNALAQSESRISLALVADRDPPKYVYFRQLQGAGFNNQVQEVLLFHHLAQETSRVYVYQPLIWQPRRASLPLSAFLPGVTEEQSITSAVFDTVCPPSQVKHVSLDLGNTDAIWEHAKEVLSRPDRCIVVDDWIFRWTFLASSSIHPIWPSFQQYLALHFRWSGHILDMVERARPTEPYMALHLRRGDFEDHCRGLASSQMSFTTWATLPRVNDAVLSPSLDPTNETSVMEHCYPSLRRILDAIDSQARANPHINGLHVLHDGAWDHPLVYLAYFKLETAVKSPQRTLTAGWKGGPMKVVTHSGTLPVRRGESDWAVAVDVELARKASVFIGNGYSSLSSQIVALRLANERARISDMTLL